MFPSIAPDHDYVLARCPAEVQPDLAEHFAACRKILSESAEADEQLSRAGVILNSHPMLPKASGRVVDAITSAIHAYREEMCDRLLAERGDEVIINRCTACSKVLSTPRAKQCLWCGNDWHKKQG